MKNLLTLGFRSFQQSARSIRFYPKLQRLSFNGGRCSLRRSFAGAGAALKQAVSQYQLQKQGQEK